MKPGYKTTEFVTVIVSAVVSVLVLTNVLPAGEEEEVAEIAIGLITAGLALAAQAAVMVEYIRGRTKLKQYYNGGG